MHPAVDLRELRTRESARVEWKEGVADEREVVRTLCAFANDLSGLGGGWVVCGAGERTDEQGLPRVEFVGLAPGQRKKLLKFVADTLKNHVTPPLVATVDELPGDDGRGVVLVFSVPASEGAHLYRESRESTGQAWVRIHDQTVKAENGLYLDLMRRKGGVPPFCNQPARGATLVDIDLLVLRDMLVRIRRAEPGDSVEAWLDPAARLDAVMPALVVRDGLNGPPQPRNFALLLFGRDPGRWVPGAWIKLSHYPGTERTEERSERTDITGTLVVQVERVLNRLREEVRTLTDKGDSRANRDRYPMRALQEALVNAVVHRDYESDQPVQVTIFSDRIEFWSPGGLDRQVRKEDVTDGSPTPVWRNQALGWIFRKLDLAQQEGQGVVTIRRSLAGEGSRPPEWEIGPASVKLTIRAHPRAAAEAALVVLERKLALGTLKPADVLSAVDERPQDPRLWELLAAVSKTDRTAFLAATQWHFGDSESMPPVDVALVITRALRGLDIPGFDAAAGRSPPTDFATALRAAGAQPSLELAQSVLQRGAAGSLALDEAARVMELALLLNLKDLASEVADRGPVDLAPTPWLLQAFEVQLLTIRGATDRLSDPALPPGLRTALIEVRGRATSEAGRILDRLDALGQPTSTLRSRLAKALAAL